MFRCARCGKRGYIVGTRGIIPWKNADCAIPDVRERASNPFGEVQYVGQDSEAAWNITSRLGIEFGVTRIRFALIPCSIEQFRRGFSI